MSLKILYSFKMVQRQLPRALAIVLATSMLACTSIGSASNQIAVSQRLPTLTRTPLPTLTPTSVAVPVAVIIPTETTGSPVMPDNSLASPSSAPAYTSTPLTVSTLSPSDPTQAHLTDLPTAEVSTITNAPIATATALPTSTPSATATELPTATPTPSATPSPDWLFVNVRLSPAADGSGLRLFGDAINKTGSSQLLEFVSATFFDLQGQIVSPTDITDYWPAEAVPPDGQIPFELQVAGIASPANFNLEVQAVPDEQTPRQDFEFSDLNQSSRGDDYCLSGSLKDQGSEPQEYLVIVTVLYDTQDKVINFGDYYESDPGEEIDEHTLNFEICVNALGQNVARHELRAWGL